MTEFVTLPPSPAPTIYVKVPDDWDSTRDVWLSDFGGALTGSVVAIIGSVLLTLWVLRKERLTRKEAEKIAQKVREETDKQALETRMDERRRNYAEHLGSSLRKLAYTVPEADPKIVMAALAEASDAAAPLLARNHKDKYEDFREWLSDAMISLTRDWLPKLRRTSKMEEDDFIPARAELGKYIALLSANATRWSSSPDDWKPLTESDLKEIMPEKFSGI